MINKKAAFCLCKLVDLAPNKPITNQLTSVSSGNDLTYPARSSLANAWDTGLPTVNVFLQLPKRIKAHQSDLPCADGLQRA